MRSASIVAAPASADRTALCLRVATCICCRGLAHVVVDPTNGKDRLVCPTDSELLGITSAVARKGRADQVTVLGTPGGFHVCRPSFRRAAILAWRERNPKESWTDATEGIEWDAWWILHGLRQAGDDGFSLSELDWQPGLGQIKKAARDAAIGLLMARGLVWGTRQRTSPYAYIETMVYRARRRA